MDKNLENINDFESLLKNRTLKKSLALYSASEHKNKPENSLKTRKISAKEVLANVSRQVKAMQNSDIVGGKRVTDSLIQYKRKEILPIDRIPVYREVLKKIPTKFETQCVSDTQLINVVENAEVIDKNTGVTQEFDKTFCQKSDDEYDDKHDDNSSRLDTEKHIEKDKIQHMISVDSKKDLEENNLNGQESKSLDNTDREPCEMDTITCYQNNTSDFNYDINVNTSQETQGFKKCTEMTDIFKVDADRAVSPILNTNRRKSSSPIVVDLYIFERFENLANPIIEEHEDMTKAKNMINSQIIGREILIPAHNYENIGRDSPVISKIESITTNFNKDDEENICTCSNNCVNKDVRCTNEPIPADINLTSDDKKMVSKIIKTEIQDEILFSSDEEYEYLHKNVQELPLTCALETSFYDRSDILDKTMYVGFQTASNKSIQINTDSFTKAKNILSDIDNEETGTTLSDLVEIFDSGKAVREHVQNIKITNNKLECTHNEAYSKIELTNNEDLKCISETLNVCLEKRDDTLANISLTGLERDREVEDGVIMSQNINFKHTSISPKLNNSTIISEKCFNTFNNEKDDDLVMSQVITFKSISRTPKCVDSACNASVTDESSDLTKVFAKRKLEGFKTASNKKNKLSDKALTLCKKVFQDIDLGDAEYITNESNITEIEQHYFKADNFLDFNTCNDDFKSSSLPHTTKEKDICDSKNIVTEVNDCGYETDVKVEQKKPTIDEMDLQIDDQHILQEFKTNDPGIKVNEQPIIEEVDLQINEQHILQEFEDNHMPLEEYNNNNNVYVGFKTASNKNITISDVAVAATKNIFQDIVTIASGNDFVSILDTAVKGLDKREKCENVIKKPAVDFREIASKHTKSSVEVSLNKSDFISGKTASHKEIIISEQAKKSTKDFYKDLDNELLNVNKDGNINSNTENKRNNDAKDEFNCGIDTQDFLAEELIHIEELFKDNTVENKTTVVPEFQGFQTASKKSIVISNKALEKSKKLFEDITNHPESEFKCDSPNVQEHEVIVKPENKDTFMDDENLFKESRFKVPMTKSNKETYNVIDMKNETPLFAGFHTASNKKVSVSKKGIEMSKIIFQDIENLNDVEHGIVSKSPLNHNKVISRDIQMSEATQGDFLNENQTMLSEFQMSNNCKGTDSKILDTKTPTFVGFKTASAKPIPISADALKRTKRLLKEFEGQDDDIFFYKDYAQTFDPKPSTSTLVGFQTASNKKGQISAKTLAKSKQILSDFQLKSNANSHNNLDDDNQTTNNLDEPSDTETVCFKEFCTHNDTDKPSTSIFFGVQTASNKEVKISDEALAKSKQVFQDVNIFDQNSDPTGEEKIEGQEKSSPVFKGFETARTDSFVRVSEKALEKNKNLLDDIENCYFSEKNKHGNAPVLGFQTASNKKVEISEKALAKSKKLFEDINLSQLDKGIAESKVGEKCSQQILTKLTQMFKEVQNDSISEFRGFQTASNKKVEISEKALVKSKKLFEDMNISQLQNDKSMLDNIANPVINSHENFLGSEIARNNKVAISHQVQGKTKNIHVEEDIYIPSNVGATVFGGFQTASNKKVKISEEALVSSRKLFDDINLSQLENVTARKTNSDKLHIAKADDVDKDLTKAANIHDNNFTGFQTASNKKVKVSKQALEKTKDTFKGTHSENSEIIFVTNEGVETPNVKANVAPEISKYKHLSPTGSKIDIINDTNREVIDTQVLNDFQCTLNTEDFCKSTPVSKRSGSPILSCPRAKKRRFETPYRTKKKIEPRNPFVPPKLAKTYKFDDDYKKHKKYTLKDIEKLEKECTKGDTDPYISEFSFDSLLNFSFIDKRNDYTAGKLTIEDLKKTFLDAVNRKIVPDGWLDNHIRLIIWKLLSYEVKFPKVMKNICSVRNVLEQLKYRYDKELYHVHRPILRKILEKDEVPSKTMVLCVAAIYVDNINVIRVPPSTQNVELLLTDGWYCVKASLDQMLVGLVAAGAIVVGSKIVVCGAELINCEQGVAPWEDTSSVRLKLHGNSTRRARWWAGLGARAGAVTCALRAARAAGGNMAAARVHVARVYPPLFLERMDDGSTVTLSERLENIRQMKYESERQAVMEKLYEEVEKEMSDLESQDSEGCSNEKNMESGSQISKCIKNSKDPDEYRSHLTKTQSRMLEDYNARQREKLIERVRERFQQKLKKNGLNSDRNVVPLLKVRVVGLSEQTGNVEVTKGYLSIWKPSAAVLDLVTEGAWIEMLNVIPTGIRNSEIQLSAGRQTIFHPYKQTNEKFKLYANTVQRKCYEIKEISQNPSMTTDFNEIDTVGMIFCIEPSTKDFQENFQNVYLADADKNIICVNFWGGLKKFGFQNILDTGQIITCVNLQKRAGNTRKSIPQYRVTEFSYFTKTPKSKKAIEMTEELTSKLSKITDKFCEDCVVLKNNYSVFKTRNNETVSPYRFDYNIPKNITPLRNCDTNLNLTGLDFESSFNSQDISPQALLRKKKVNEKIEKIRIYYGEPPPLSSMHIINKSKNATATYKSPLISNLERSKVECPLQNSPVSMNRTYVKSVNPVKLDFSNDLNESDHFAEDFDASPPLSLDSDILK